jgi:hypothetical protein
MKFKLAISALAACTLMSGAALADAPQKKNKNQNQTSAGSVAGGVAVAGPDGAGAAGVAGSRAQSRQMQRQQRRHGNKGGQQAMTTQRACVPGTASTSTTGAAYTDRRTGSASIATNGTASGDGTVRSSSEGEVYSSTDKTGSQADAYGNSTAVATEPTRPC